MTNWRSHNYTQTSEQLFPESHPKPYCIEHRSKNEAETLLQISASKRGLVKQFILFKD